MESFVNDIFIIDRVWGAVVLAFLTLLAFIIDLDFLIPRRRLGDELQIVFSIRVVHFEIYIFPEPIAIVLIFMQLFHGGVLMLLLLII